MTQLERFFNKLKEPSTIKGLILIAALLGINIDPDLQEKITTAAIALYGLIQVFVSKD